MKRKEENKRMRTRKKEERKIRDIRREKQDNKR